MAVGLIFYLSHSYITNGIRFACHGINLSGTVRLYDMLRLLRSMETVHREYSDTSI